MIAEQLKLYLVTDRSLCADNNLEDIVIQAVKAGVTMVQLREKTLCTAEFISEAKRLKKALMPYNVPLIINDRVDVALASDADGVHLGQSDMSYEDAKRLLGRDKIIGLSIENFAELEIANKQNLDYVAFSPIFSTSTKTDTASPFGLEGVKKGVKLSKHPTCAIGGINLSNVKEVMECGLNGVAVVSAIIASNNPQKASSDFINLINKQV